MTDNRSQQNSDNIPLTVEKGFQATDSKHPKADKKWFRDNVSF